MIPGIQGFATTPGYPGSKLTAKNHSWDKEKKIGKQAVQELVTKKPDQPPITSYPRIPIMPTSQLA